MLKLLHVEVEDWKSSQVSSLKKYIRSVGHTLLAVNWRWLLSKSQVPLDDQWHEVQFSENILEHLMI